MTESDSRHKELQKQLRDSEIARQAAENQIASLQAELEGARRERSEAAFKLSDVNLKYMTDLLSLDQQREQNKEFQYNIDSLLADKRRMAKFETLYKAAESQIVTSRRSWPCWPKSEGHDRSGAPAPVDRDHRRTERDADPGQHGQSAEAGGNQEAGRHALSHCDYRMKKAAIVAAFFHVMGDVSLRRNSSRCQGSSRNETRGWPSTTCAPSRAISATTPSCGAAIVCSIFMASRTSIACPLETASPALTRTIFTRPGIGARSEPEPPASASRARGSGAPNENVPSVVNSVSPSGVFPIRASAARPPSSRCALPSRT